jgi:thioredoxin reductase
MPHDVIVIGGSYAGMAAALQLLRARRKVLVIDAGVRRNRFASASHGFLGQDGADPAQIARAAREQLMAYPTLTWVECTATGAERRPDDFAVTTSDGGRHEGRRLILATGVSDTLPPVAGLSERWGKSVFHCPYCHGYELDRGRIGVIATGPVALHQAILLTEWGDVTLLLNRAFEPGAQEREQLVARGVKIEANRIARIEGHADVRLEDGRMMHFAGLFTATRNAPSTPLWEALGCEMKATPFGTQILTDATKQTTVPGVFACGDAAQVPHSVSLAVGDGAMTGMHVHRSLVF